MLTYPSQGEYDSVSQYEDIAMVLARITFPCKSKIDKAAFKELVDWHLGELYSSGQIFEPPLFAFHGDLTAYVETFHPSLLQKKYMNQEAKDTREEIVKKSGNTPVIKIIDEEKPIPLPDWEKADFLVLYADIGDQDCYPLVMGNTGNDIPTCLLPLPDRLKHNLNCWRRYHHALMQVWYETGSLEMSAYNELANPESDFMERNWVVERNEIETAIGIPTYVYLFRYWGRRKGEENRVCPKCGKSWKMREPILVENEQRLWRLDFKCDDCRLVSALADCYDDERHARIGEYKKKAR